MRNQRIVNQQKVSQTEQQKRNLINKALKRIIEDNYYDVEVEPVFKKGNITKLANQYSFTDKYISEVQNKVLLTHYYVIYKDGSYSPVEDREYDVEYADNTLEDIHEKNNIYVKDYLNKDVIAIVEYGYDTDSIDDEELIVYEI